MNLNRLNRKIHYWATAFVVLPVLIIIGTGLLLQVKKQSSWIQPDEQSGTGTVPRVSIEEILEAVRARDDLDVDGWKDIDRMDIRPGKGIVKVLLQSGWEAQIDLGTAEVLQTAYRRSDLIESIHDGSFFGGDWVKLGLFLPSGFILLFMWASGLWMFWLPFSRRRRKRNARRRTTATRSKQTDLNHKEQLERLSANRQRSDS